MRVLEHTEKVEYKFVLKDVDIDDTMSESSFINDLIVVAFGDNYVVYFDCLNKRLYRRINDGTWYIYKFSKISTVTSVEEFDV